MPGPSLQTFPRDAAFDSIMAGLAADGGVIVQDFIDQDLLGRLNAQLQAHVERTDAGSERVQAERRRFWGSRTKRFSRLAARAPAFVELLEHEFMHRWARHTLAADYWLNTGQAMIVGPGEDEQVLHRDIGIWPYIQKMGKAAPEAMVSMLLALSDFSEAVGATRVSPRGDGRRQCLALSRQDRAWGRRKSQRGHVAPWLAHELRLGLAHPGGGLADRRSLEDCAKVLAARAAHVGVCIAGSRRTRATAQLAHRFRRRAQLPRNSVMRLKNLLDLPIRNGCHACLSARSRAADTPPTGPRRDRLRLDVDDARVFGLVRRPEQSDRIARLPKRRQRAAGGSSADR
jgi:hypothetical protein